MNSKRLSEIKNKLKGLLKKKEVVDVILFGSAIKGKENPGDIDIAVISECAFSKEIKGFHVSSLKPKEFIENPPTLATTLLKEGHSLKKNQPFSENFRFKQRVMFVYALVNLEKSGKVRIVNLLRGKKNQKGMVEEFRGEWLSNNVFLSDINSEHIFSQFFISNKIKFKKFNLLLH